MINIAEQRVGISLVQDVQGRFIAPGDSFGQVQFLNSFRVHSERGFGNRIHCLTSVSRWKEPESFAKLTKMTGAFRIETAGDIMSA